MKLKQRFVVVLSSVTIGFLFVFTVISIRSIEIIDISLVRPTVSDARPRYTPESGKENCWQLWESAMSVSQPAHHAARLSPIDTRSKLATTSGGANRPRPVNVSLTDLANLSYFLSGSARSGEMKYARRRGGGGGGGGKCARDLGDTLGISPAERSALPAWRRLHLGITDCELYRDEDSDQQQLISQLSWDIAHLPIDEVEMFEGGTQLKLLVILEDESKLILKPKRMRREDQTLPDHFYFVDYERHNAEIAAFHVDRLLGFHRVPPTVGRLINITSEIYERTEEDLSKTFFVSPGNNVCFTGACSYYCDTPHAVCGGGASGARGDLLEVSLSLMLPSQGLLRRAVWRHPWKRSYHRKRRALWEQDGAGAGAGGYCTTVRGTDLYRTGRRLLDLMDTAIFDFIIGNMDRHHYESFTHISHNESFVIHLDQGRGFGRYDKDEMSILAPVRQCCLIRMSTLRTLLHYYRGYHNTTLGEAVKQALDGDVLSPVLYPEHYTAVDRRVELIIQLVISCVRRNNAQYKQVIIDDGY